MLATRRLVIGSVLVFIIVAGYTTRVWTDEPKPTTKAVQYKTIQATTVVPPGAAYHSDNLNADFETSYMYIMQEGQVFEFWGGRVVGMGVGSPLHALGLRLGDVITRLDGISIADNMYRVGDGPWQLVETERHYGATEVRYILAGTDDVRVGEIYLYTHPGGGGPIIHPYSYLRGT